METEAKGACGNPDAEPCCNTCPASFCDDCQNKFHACAYTTECEGCYKARGKCACDVLDSDYMADFWRGILGKNRGVTVEPPEVEAPPTLLAKAKAKVEWLDKSGIITSGGPTKQGTLRLVLHYMMTACCVCEEKPAVFDSCGNEDCDRDLHYEECKGEESGLHGDIGRLCVDCAEELGEVQNEIPFSTIKL